jgi:hypothetical protein
VRSSRLNLRKFAPAKKLRVPMPAIMADHDIEGQMQVLLHLLPSREWRALWTELAIPVESFVILSISPDISDAALWQFCQTHQIILLTANRNREGSESLEAIIRAGIQVPIKIAPASAKAPRLLTSKPTPSSSLLAATSARRGRRTMASCSRKR